MRLLIAAAVALAVGLPSAAFAAAPTQGATPKQKSVSSCSQIKTPAARENCRKKAVATKPATSKPVKRTTAQRKPTGKKPAQPATASVTPTGSTI